MWITIVASATDWGNFFALRTADDAQPEIRELARRMAVAYYTTQPEEVPAGYWHLPYVLPDERSTLHIVDLKKTSTARVARVSYLTHGGVRDPAEDFRLHDQLLASGHWSPFEHLASALTKNTWHGNFQGWLQYRKEFEPELENRSFTPTLEQLGRWKEEYAL
jgi:thymidylate synthase ThyX